MVTSPTPALAGAHGWDQASSIGRDAIVLAALGYPALQGDWKGDKQAALGMGSAFALTGLLKVTVHETRPDGSNRQSFPSGHTSVSFAAAATLEKRYGWQIGVPAHLLAAFVGVARVKARKHYVRDVIAGGLIGEASGLLLSSKRDARTQWVPWGDTHSAGATVALRF
ncbi:phosphatase PAP2 family protein [Sphingomonas sp. RB1R13]|uniref:phosphatase PAP2 family protein n=1 Tax=Sphingomonas sp. RB1R13 TaxID=3096159 RepID=UPI002FCBB5BF